MSIINIFTKWKIRKQLTLVVVIELIIIFLILILINQSSKPTYYFPLIRKEESIFSSNSHLKHFYEPKQNKIVKDKNIFTSYIPEYTINSDGLNERFDYEIKKDPKVFRIIVLGDSFTFGKYVDTKDNYVERLEDKLNSKIFCPKYRKLEVINLGVGGYDMEYAVERLKKRGMKYNPDLVLWFVRNDDFEQLLDKMYDKVKEYGKQMAIDGTYQQSIREGSYFPEYVRVTEELNIQYGEEFISQYRRKNLEDFLQTYDGPLLIFTFPTHHKIKEFLSNSISLSKNWFLYGDLIYVPKYNGAFPDSHPNVFGHELIAEDLYNYLLIHKMIPCQ